jgi:hypothetical protein
VSKPLVFPAVSTPQPTLYNHQSIPSHNFLVACKDFQSRALANIFVLKILISIDGKSWMFFGGQPVHPLWAAPKAHPKTDRQSSI